MARLRPNEKDPVRQGTMSLASILARKSSDSEVELEIHLMSKAVLETCEAWWLLCTPTRGVQLLSYLLNGPFQVLMALADAKLPWKQDPKATEGLQLFAHHTAEEIGSFTAVQIAQILDAFARMGSSFEALAVADQTMMRSLSKLFMRRIVREPLSPQETAKVAVAFSALRVRDVGLFNATTLGLCRPEAIQALSWMELAHVAVAYAIRVRIADSSSPIPCYEDFEVPVPLSPQVVARFLEAQLHLGQVGLQEAGHLLPHMAHSAGPSGRPSIQLSKLLIIFLARGSHAFPWLWRRAIVGAFSEVDARRADAGKQRLLPMNSLVPLLESFAEHLRLLQPVLDEADPMLTSHIQVLTGGLVKLWALVAKRSGTLPDSELRQAGLTAPELFKAQFNLGEVMRNSSLSNTGRALNHASLKAIRCISREMLRREWSEEEAVELVELLDQNGIQPAWLLEDLRIMKKDSIRNN
ncbi:Hypothetical protein (Fragment) [Durusdinium trenchii]|uniref:Uncharacterized protein n=1 Tax=Durusdinium trenchii TaxID=1381693 RepID=A0ABP0HZ36_9DINO